MSYYDHTSSFHFKSKLSDARKAQIVEWVKSLTPEQKEMLDDMIQDTIDDERFFADGD